MKRLLALALALCMVFSMMPVSAHAGTTQTNENVEISLWTYPIGGWGQEAQLSELIAAFEADNPGISVNVTVLDYVNGDTTVSNAIADGTAPDLIMEGPERLVSMWGNAGHLADLSDLLDDTDRAEISANALNACFGSNGELYQYPLCVTVHTMAINKTVFEAAGAMQYINQDTRTWKSTEDFFQAIQAVYDYTGHTVGKVYCGGRGGDQGTRALVNNLYGGTYTNAGHTAYTWDSAENIAALQALYDCEGIAFDPIITGGEEIEQFYNGGLNVAFCWNIYQQMHPNNTDTAGVTADGDEIMFLAFPSDETPRLCSGIWGFGAFDNGDDARLAAAKEFIRYMCDSEATADAVRLSGYFPARDTAGSVDLTNIWAGDSIMADYQPLTALLGDYYVVAPNWGDARSYWAELLADVAGGRDAAEAAAYWNAMANANNPVVPVEKTQLHMVAPLYGTNSEAWWQQFEADFEAAYPDIDLIAEVLSWDDIYTRVNDLIANGENPDILNLDMYADYQAQGLLLPVEDYMSDATYAKFPQTFLDQSGADGKIWAVPDLTSTRALYYNKTVFDELGLEAPTSWKELMECCYAIAESDYGIPALGMDMSADEGFATFAQFIWANGGDFLDADGNWALNSDSNVEAVEFAAGLVTEGLTNDDPANQSRYDLQDMFCNGQLAMVIAPDSFSGWLEGVDYGVDYGVAVIPANVGTSHAVGVMDRFMCFDNGYTESELAAVTAFFDFFYEDSRYAAWATMEGFLPATSTGMDVLAQSDPTYAVWKTAVENVKFYPADKAEWLSVREGVVEVLQQAILGGDPQELLDALQEEVAGTDPGEEEFPTSGTCGANLTWTLDDFGILTISGEGAMTDFYLDGPDLLPVTPWNASDVRIVVIEEGVTSIGFYAFMEHDALDYVELPETLSTIGAQAFTGSGIREITIPESVTYIGQSAFSNCDNLTSIRIPDGVERLTVHTFCGCDNLRIVALGEKVRGFTDCVFDGCSSLDIMIFTGDAFSFKDSDFTNLEFTAYYPAYNDTWTEDVMQNYGGNVTWVAYDANYVASGTCGEKLTWFLLDDGTLTISGEGAMKNCGEWEGSPWFGYANLVTTVILEPGVTTIGEYIFHYCDSLTTVTIPDTVAAIGKYAFTACNSLSSVTIPAGVTAIAEYAFSNCYALEEISFQGDAPEIGSYAFNNVTATAYYPAGNDTWTEDNLQNYGGSLTWVARNPFDFTSFEELKRLVAENQTEYIGAVNYIGSEPLVIEEDIRIPWTMGVGSHEQPVIVPEGVTLQTDNLFYATELTIDGTMNAVAVEIGDALTVNGTLNVEAQVYLYHQNVVLTGEENINFLNSAILCLGYDVNNMDELLEAMDIAAADTNPRHLYSAVILEEMTIDQSLTLPDNFQLRNDAPVTIAAGCTLTTSYICGFRSAVRVEGTLVNTNGVNIIHTDLYQGSLTIADGGEYAGNGIIRVYIPGGDDPTVVLSGIDTSRFDIVFDEQGGGWIMTPKAIPAPVVAVTNVASTGKIKLTWNKVEGAAKYQVWRSMDKKNWTLLKTTTGTSLTNTSTEAGELYYYYVVAVAEDGTESEPSAIVSRRCDLPRPVITLSNVASTGKIKITWEKIEGAVKYEVYRSTDNKTWSKLSTVSGTSLTNTSTTAGTLYYYKVKAIASNSGANSAYSTVKSRRCDLARPSITSLTIIASSGKIKVKWGAVDGAVKYELYYSTDNENWTKLITTTGTTVSHNSAVAGTRYYYKVKAIASDTSANSAYSTVKNGYCDLARPTLTVKLNSSGKPYLTWTKISGAVKYEVYRSTDNKTWTKLSTTTGTKLTNTSAKSGTTYYYKVRAIASVSNANSAYSTVKSIAAK